MSNNGYVYYIDKTWWTAVRIDIYYYLPEIKNVKSIVRCFSNPFYFFNTINGIYFFATDYWRLIKIKEIDGEIKQVFEKKMRGDTFVKYKEFVYYILSNNGYLYYLDFNQEAELGFSKTAKAKLYYNTTKIKNNKLIQFTNNFFSVISGKSLTFNFESWEEIDIEEIKEIKELKIIEKKYNSNIKYSFYILSESGYVYFVKIQVPESRYLKKTQIQILSPTLITFLTKAQIQSLTPNEIRSFTPEQIQTLTPEQMIAFTAEQIPWFTIKQIKAFVPKQIKAFTPIQIGSFLSKQIKAFTSEQIKSLTENQISYFLRYQIPEFTENQQHSEVIVKKSWVGVRIDREYNLPDITNVKSMQGINNLIYFNTANGIYFMTNENWKLTQIKGMIGIPKLPYFKKFLMVDNWWFENLKRDFPDWNSNKIINLGLIYDNNDNDIKTIVKKKYPNLKMNDIEFIKDYSYFQEDVKTNISFNTMFKDYPESEKHIQNSVSFGGFSAKINAKDSSNHYSFGILKPKFIYVTQTKINEISNIIANDRKVKQWINHINEYNRRLPLLKEELDIDLRNLQSGFFSFQKKRRNK